ADDEPACCTNPSENESTKAGVAAAVSILPAADGGSHARSDSRTCEEPDQRTPANPAPLPHADVELCYRRPRQAEGFRSPPRGLHSNGVGAPLKQRSDLVVNAECGRRNPDSLPRR